MTLQAQELAVGRVSDNISSIFKTSNYMFLKMVNVKFFVQEEGPISGGTSPCSQKQGCHLYDYLMLSRLQEDASPGLSPPTIQPNIVLNDPIFFTNGSLSAGSQHSLEMLEQVK